MKFRTRFALIRWPKQIENPLLVNLDEARLNTILYIALVVLDMLENLATCARHDACGTVRQQPSHQNAPIISDVGLSGPYIVNVFPEPVCP